ncbi:hypothetical protein [Sulfuricystis multivorans]|uniref:hypothetical protein n=1 Tax=Sulfuricystis multivorans TaxID=2211108 RepID=UPI000F823BC0|nr:hypothetical protein [Sulfuricystis multivorans]
MVTSHKPYPFDDAWKATVDRNGIEWMAYCEAVAIVKQYIRTRLLDGKDAAIEEFKATCELYCKNDPQGAVRIARIKEHFQLIWANERETLKAKVLEEASLLQSQAK